MHICSQQSKILCKALHARTTVRGFIPFTAANLADTDLSDTGSLETWDRVFSRWPALRSVCFSPACSPMYRANRRLVLMILVIQVIIFNKIAPELQSWPKFFRSCWIQLNKTELFLSTRAIWLLEIQLLLERQDKYLIYSK